MAKVPEEVEQPPIYGTPDDDVIFDTSNGNDFYGSKGDDVFVAHATDAAWNGYHWVHQDDYFHGGSGSDTITYVLSDKRILANLEAGIVYRIWNDDAQSTDELESVENLNGSNFDDTIYGSRSANKLLGGGGADTIYAASGNDQVWGGSGHDILEGADGNDVVDGGTGNDDVRGGYGADTLTGGDGNDELQGGTDNDRLNGGAHNDSLFGGSGNDRLQGGTGNDLLDGGSGTDSADYTGFGAVTVNLWLGTASGAWGNDKLASVERVETGGGNDLVFGGFDSNRLTTSGGNDIVYALDGHDVVYSGSGNDTVDGYEGNDLIYAGTGNDRVWGGDDGDTIYGEDDQDLISGDAGNDALYGGTGSDKLRGGDGFDTINGGSGPDIIAWGKGDSGQDTVAGFNIDQDKLWFEAGYFDTDAVGPLNLADVLIVVDSGPDAVLRANTAEQGWTNIATLQNVDAWDVFFRINDGSILAPPATDLGGLLG
jgi:Ca2+-binding RTX toxin-like protein